MNKHELIHALIEHNMVKLGKFTLKSGQTTPIYINLREMIAYPQLLTTIADTIYAQKPHDFKPDLICGVPYSALTLMTYLSIRHDIPMILKRKEAKTYGTKQLLEGIFTPGMNCVVIEDVLTTGQSTVETINHLRAAGLEVTEVLAFIDREQGSHETLTSAKIKHHTAFTLKELLTEMLAMKRITEAEHQDILAQLQN
jgi:uridine monophosphate synthetase